MEKLIITRKIDELGRVVIPIEMRQALDLAEHDLIVLSLDGDSGVLTIEKETPSCVCCHCATGLKCLPNHKYLCEACFTGIE